MTSKKIYNAFLSDSHGVEYLFPWSYIHRKSNGFYSSFENIRLYEKRKLLSHIETTSSTLEKQLHALKRHRNVGDVRGRGLMFGVELVTDKDSKTPLEIGKS